MAADLLLRNDSRSFSLVAHYFPPSLPIDACMQQLEAFVCKIFLFHFLSINAHHSSAFFCLLSFIVGRIIDPFIIVEKSDLSSAILLSIL